MDNNIKKNSEELLNRLSSLSELELSELITLHNDLYFNKNEPTISDEAFDKLVLALKFKNPHAEVLAIVGARSEAGFGQEVRHLRPMLSLDKCYDDDAFLKWAEKINGALIAMPKIDGVASSLLYDAKGELFLAATRGDGRVGEDITENVKMIESVPKHIDTKKLPMMIDAGDFLEVRGEMYLPLERFRQFYAEEFANPRNLAAGALKNKDSEKSKSYGLKFIPYDLRGVRGLTEAQKFSLLEALGFASIPWRLESNFKNAAQVFVEFYGLRSSFDYETDGVVFRANEEKDQQRLGETAHHPRYALAYKWQTESAQTKLIDVLWSVSRTGAVTPVAIFAPVFLSGATISRASLHNLGIFSKLAFTKNCLVEINRRGGVIPHVERVLSNTGEPLLAPSACPSCASAVVIDGDFLMCSAPDQCPEIVVSSIIHFCSVLGLEGFGDKIIRRLYEQKLIKSFADLFSLTLPKLNSLERMGDVLSQKLLDQINSKREIGLATFLRALGIKEVGGTVSEIIAANFHSLAQIEALTATELMPIHGIGERIAHALVEGLLAHKHVIIELKKQIIIKDYEEEHALSNEGHVLYNKSIVFTGKMAHLDRKSAQNLVKKLGGLAPGSISVKTDYLVIGDEGSSLLGEGTKSTKQKEAEKLVAAGAQLKIISESEFLRMAKEQ